MPIESARQSLWVVHQLRPMEESPGSIEQGAR